MSLKLGTALIKGKVMPDFDNFSLFTTKQTVTSYNPGLKQVRNLKLTKFAHIQAMNSIL